MEWIFWVVLFIVAVAFQLRSVFTGTKWGMLTTSVRWLRARLWARLALFPLWSWLTYHWFLEPRGLGGDTYWDDAIAIVVGIIIALVADYDDYFKTVKQEEDIV